MMELVCVRHGRTAWNAERRFQGQTDVPLDDVGRAQAQALAVHLAGERFDFARASDLVRAWETASGIAAATGANLEPDVRLREMRFGSWEGLTWPQIVERHPELGDGDGTSPKYYVPQGGETFDDVRARVRLVLDEVVPQLGPDGRALIVAHAGTLHALLSVALDVDDEAALGLKFVPAAIMRLRGDGRSPWTLAAFNEIAPPLAESAPVTP
jgi:broad specificity phosphatase PhoE